MASFIIIILNVESTYRSSYSLNAGY
jgi:hypothetical protein